MLEFLKQNWLWIAAPIVLFLVALGALVFFADGDSASPFIYNIF